MTDAAATPPLRGTDPLRTILGSVTIARAGRERLVVTGSRMVSTPTRPSGHHASGDSPISCRDRWDTTCHWLPTSTTLQLEHRNRDMMSHFIVHLCFSYPPDVFASEPCAKRPMQIPHMARKARWRSIFPIRLACDPTIGPFFSAILGS